MKTSIKLKVGDVVWVNLNPSLGSEKNKIRPCVVLEAEVSQLSLFLAVPITDLGSKRSSIFIPIENYQAAGLKKPSAIDTYQIRCLDTQRVIKKSGQISEETLDQVKSNLVMIFDLDPKKHF